MTEWLLANWGTFLVALILIGIITVVIVVLIKRKKQGKSSCGGDCAPCAMGSSCHKK